MIGGDGGVDGVREDGVSDGSDGDGDGDGDGDVGGKCIGHEFLLTTDGSSLMAATNGFH